MQLRTFPGTDDPPSTVTVEGTGEIEIEIDKATTATVGFDYSTADKVTLRLQAERGIRIRGGSGLTLSGGVAFNTLQNQLTGSAGIEIEVSKNVAVAIEQEFARGKYGTKIGFKIKL